MKTKNYLIPVLKNAIRLTTLVAILVLSTITSQSQNINKNVRKGDWISLMRDRTVNVHDVQKAFYQWYKKNKKEDKDNPTAGKEKGDESYELFKRWEWYNLPRADVNGNRADQYKVASDYDNYVHHSSAHRPTHSISSNASWTYAGNTAVPLNSSSGYGGNGRVNRVRVFPGNKSIMFACAASGGLWKTTNGGTSWSTVTDQLGDLSTSDIAINPLKTNVMYLATGDGDGIQSIYQTPATIGVLKSSDGGNTWTATGLAYTLSVAGASYYSVNELLIDPNDTSVILAATSFGVYRSSNSGATWTQTSSATWFHSIEFEPGHPAIVYAASSNIISGVGANFYRSVDNGQTWTLITSGLPSNTVAEGYDIGVTAADSTVVYLLADNQNTVDFNGLYLSTNHGVSFSTQSTSPNVLGRANDGSDWGTGQGWYDLTMAVSQTNKDSIWVGGINIWASSNGGVTWSLNADWFATGAPFVHADIHDIQFIPGTNSQGYVVGCDGGVFTTSNSGTAWTNISSNLGIGQQYCIGASASTSGRWITGWQDNGTNLSSSPWSQVYGGDGMDCFIDWSNDKTFYAETPDGAFVQSTDGGNTWNNIVNGINENGNWVTVWLQDPKTSTTLYSGFNNVWKSTNSGGNWSAISSWGGTGAISALAVDSANTNYIYAAQGIWYSIPSSIIEVTSNGGSNWTNITGTLPVNSAAITAIAVNSKNPSYVWVTFSGYSAGNKVFASSNGGTTWTNISAGLPNLPVNCIVSESGSPNGIYIGTDQGVYYHDTILNSWVFYNTGLPMVMIGDLKIYKPGKQLLAATYGRGTWTTSLYVTAAPLTVSANVTNNVSCNGGKNGSLSASPSGGTSPYTYSWSTGAITSSVSGLSAGTYTIKVTDNASATATATVVITQPAALGAGTTVNANVSCNGGNTGKATASASGGSSPYTYSWTNGNNTVIASNLAAGNYTITVTDKNGCTATAIAAITQPSAFTGTVTVNANVSCNGGSNGSMSANPSGGTSPYTYSWTGGSKQVNATGLSAGTYTVTITDNNGCTATAIGTITQPSAFTGTITVNTNVSCNGGSNGNMSANPSGGTSPYTYSWTGGSKQVNATGLSAGTYTVTITDKNGCTATAKATITQPSALTVTTTINSNISCNGGANGNATANPSGGTSPYTYSWTNGSTNANVWNFTAGKYTVTVTDNNGCIATSSAAITAPVALTASAVVNNNASGCSANGSISVSTGGGTSPYTYLWTNGNTASTATGLSGGNYTVTVTDNNGCTATAATAITAPIVVSAGITINNNVTCNGGNNGSASVNAIGGASPYTYSWTNGSTNATATGLSANLLLVTVTDNNGCTATASAAIMQPPVMVSGITLTNISCHSGSNGSITANPSLGASPYTYSWNTGKTTASITGLSAGSFTLTVKDNNGCIVTASAILTQPSAIRDSIISASRVNISCYGGSNGGITAGVKGGTSPYTFSWSPGGQTTQTVTNLSAGSYTVTISDNNGCSSSTLTTSFTQPAQLTDSIISSTLVNVKCNGSATGSATVGVKGGTAPYTYSWLTLGKTTNTASGLSAGNYTVNVTDNRGCTNSASLVITQNTALTAGIATTGNDLCNGQANVNATATASGGVSPYTYSWSNGVTGSATTGIKANTYTLTVTDNDHCTATATVSITQPAVLTAGATVSVAISCYGGASGSATANPAGGTSPYTYSWSGSGTNITKTGLTAGTYTVKVTDNHGCTATSTVNLSQPAVLKTTITPTYLTCNGTANGSATANLTGGTSPYTYSWNNGNTNSAISSLSAGGYTVSVKDNHGCNTTASVSITQPGLLKVSTTIIGVSCNGGSNGSITASPAGGTSPYTYSWTNGGISAANTGLSAGTYTVNVTDKHGCAATASASVNQPSLLKATPTVKNATCNGGANGRAIANPAGGSSPYTYSWNNGVLQDTATGLSAGTYTVKVTDKHGCTATSAAVITQPAAIRDSIKSFSCSNHLTTASIGVKGGTSPYTYLWSPGGGTNATITGLSNGAYTVTVTDKNGCTGITLTPTFSCAVAPDRNGGGENNTDCCPFADNINLYPNPNTGQFTLSGLEKGMTVEIYNYTGKRISRIIASDNTMQVNLSDHANGIYLVRIISPDGTVVSRQKMVKIQ